MNYDIYCRFGRKPSYITVDFARARSRKYPFVGVDYSTARSESEELSSDESVVSGYLRR